ncbi:AraC family transcriptional regulator [Qingshengfaniella alkalisoli]|uniref:AraC family transcriptional regulator n=1 Tax=Qingshengfaniella alkalisoli TaxID=2599296 RepID=A0A5B8JBF2_9RHOB|nr:AraC family transcriptional regulator [Qingshengfaniella alkalisoli]QDY71607.1 AraC family transcriptional regulator [Qingshengfaniella alkalisoli]
MQEPCLDTLKTRAMAIWHDHGRENPLPGLFVTVTDEPTGPFHSTYRPSLIVVLQGAKVSHLGNRTYRYDGGKCLIASLDVPIRAEIVTASAEAPYVAFALNIEPASITELLLQTSPEARSVGPTPVALGVHGLPELVLDPLERLLALVERPNDIPVLAPMIKREIIWYLLNSPQGAMLRQIGLTDSRMARIGKSIAWVRGNFTQTLSIPHLAALAGMSPATFHRHFKTATAMTPVQFQKQLRLQEARRLLLSDSADVTQVGFAIGYESPSQFSREYRRMFGAPPGRDAVAIRRVMSNDVHA